MSSSSRLSKSSSYAAAVAQRRLAASAAEGRAGAGAGNSVSFSASSYFAVGPLKRQSSDRRTAVGIGVGLLLNSRSLECPAPPSILDVVSTVAAAGSRVSDGGSSRAAQQLLQRISATAAAGAEVDVSSGSPRAGQQPALQRRSVTAAEAPTSSKKLPIVTMDPWGALVTFVAATYGNRAPSSG